MKAIKDCHQRLREEENTLNHSFEGDLEISMEGSVPDTPSQYSKQTLPHLVNDDFQLSNYLLSGKHLMISPALGRGLRNNDAGKSKSPKPEGSSKDDINSGAPLGEIPARVLFPDAGLGSLLKNPPRVSTLEASYHEKELDLKGGTMTKKSRSNNTYLQKLNSDQGIRSPFPSHVSSSTAQPLFGTRPSPRPSTSHQAMQLSSDRRIQLGRDLDGDSQAQYGSSGSTQPAQRLPGSGSSAMIDYAFSRKHPLLKKRMLFRSPSSPSVSTSATPPVSPPPLQVSCS